VQFRLCRRFVIFPVAGKAYCVKSPVFCRQADIGLGLTDGDLLIGRGRQQNEHHGLARIVDPLGQSTLLKRDAFGQVVEEMDAVRGVSPAITMMPQVAHCNWSGRRAGRSLSAGTHVDYRNTILPRTVSATSLAGMTQAGWWQPVTR
jgi:YD repeat-containing protein